MEIKTHSARLSVESITDAGHFKGIAAVYDNVAFAKEMDVLLHGAFTRTVNSWKKSRKRVPFLYQHDPSLVLGSVDPDDTNRGLEIEGDFDLNTQLGKEKHSLVRNGHIMGLSIGFMDVPTKTERRKTEHGIMRFMKEVKLFEVSLVTFPADEDAQIENIHRAFYEKPFTTHDAEKIMTDLRQKFLLMSLTPEQRAKFKYEMEKIQMEKAAKRAGVKVL